MSKWVEEALRRRAELARQHGDVCGHVDQIGDVSPRTDGCEECLAMGDQWVHLRLCMVCGHVGCCDHSKNRHATKHYQATGHPLIQSLEAWEDWVWCYADQVYVAGQGDDD